MRATREGLDWIFVSDAHFTGREPGEVESFIRFMDLERTRMDRLVILGDFFEFLFGFRRTSRETSFPFSEYLPVLEQLQELYRQGIRITYFEGNHDFHLGNFFPDYFDMNVEVHPEEWEERLGEKRAFVAHGDLSNPKQWGYRVFRRALKNRWTYGLIQWGGPRLTRRIAQWMSEMSYQTYHDGSATPPSPAFRTFGRRKFSEGFEIVILGHSHFPEEAEEWIEGRRCLYFNVGDWATHRSFLRFTPPDQFHLRRFQVGNEAVRGQGEKKIGERKNPDRVMGNRAVFLDRDGTVNEEIGYMNRVEWFKLLPRAGRAIRLLNENNFKTVVMTNQSGVARGYFPESLVHEVHQKMRVLLGSEGARLDGIYYCPHHPDAGSPPYRQKCRCRKPETGMVEEAVKELDIDCSRSYVIGDRGLDMEFALRIGAKGILVLTGYGKEEWEDSGSQWKVKPFYIAEDLYDAVRWILLEGSKKDKEG